MKKNQWFRIIKFSIIKGKSERSNLGANCNILYYYGRGNLRKDITSCRPFSGVFGNLNEQDYKLNSL